MYTGLSCESCAGGTFRSNLTSNPFDGCSPCDCNGRAQLCHPDTGICLDCQPGTTGVHCESCAANVQEPNCDMCQPDHYGFGTDLFDGGCAGSSPSLIHLNCLACSIWITILLHRCLPIMSSTVTDLHTTSLCYCCYKFLSDIWIFLSSLAECFSL